MRTYLRKEIMLGGWATGGAFEGHIHQKNYIKTIFRLHANSGNRNSFNEITKAYFYFFVSTALIVWIGRTLFLQ
jgi:hypothetical protein